MLFTDPRTWTHSAVGTWWRFAFIAVLNSALLIFAVFVAADSGFRSGVIAAVMPIMFQLLFLYALRRMYRQATEVERVNGAV